MKWANYIIENKVPILSIIELLHYPRPISMRFIWLIGHLCDVNPSAVSPAVNFFFKERNKVNFPNYDRSLAKMANLCEIPKESEAEIIDLLFCWILNPKIIVTTKNYSLEALLKISKDHPELKNEIRIVIEDQVKKNSISFEKHAGKILVKL